MTWKQWLTIFLIAFIGMCGIISVDEQCRTVTGEGGNIGLTISKTADGGTDICFFGLEF